MSYLGNDARRVHGYGRALRIGAVDRKWLPEDCLEKESSSHLDDTVAAAATRDLAESRTVHRGGRPTQISQVEDVGSLTADLEFEPLVYSEITED